MNCIAGTDRLATASCFIYVMVRFPTTISMQATVESEHAPPNREGVRSSLRTVSKSPEVSTPFLHPEQGVPA